MESENHDSSLATSAIIYMLRFLHYNFISYVFPGITELLRSFPPQTVGLFKYYMALIIQRDKKIMAVLLLLPAVLVVFYSKKFAKLITFLEQIDFVPVRAY